MPAISPTPLSDAELAALRKEYHAGGLSRGNLDPNPLAQFRKWFEQAREARLPEPNAMTLATAGRDGRVTTRAVLLKAMDERGLVFFTNYGSRKAQQIAENPQVALHFLWLPLERQVSVCGVAERISTAESLAYFASRPLGSRVGAWVSQQSRVISSRKLLEMKFHEAMEKFRHGEVPLPDFWGGFRVAPCSWEFWQGGENRLHDRFLYTRNPQGDWSIERLQP
ncbi:MAG: pyridoxamine 5'-phosphate oxidase [Terrimicrobiaceae bacterium]|nr:pyridoxamine 5'-phosphate oxidase [Terrimicrobiaceae bacterium]